MGTNDNVFVLQPLVLSWNHGYDVMCRPHIFPIGKVLKEGLELHAAQLSGYKLRCKRIASRARVSATQFLRSQVFHRVSHVILLLRLNL